ATATDLAMSTSTGSVRDIHIYGNSFFVSGYFTVASGYTNIAKYNLATKAIDNTWPIYTEHQVDVLYNVGTTLYMGGHFSQLLKDQKYAAAYDLVGDTLLNWNPKLDGAAYAIAASNQGIFIGGDFGTANAQTAPRLAWVDPV